MRQFSLYLDYNHSESKLRIEHRFFNFGSVTSRAFVCLSDSLLPRAKQNLTLTQIHLLRDKDSCKYKIKIPTDTWLPP